VAALEKVLGVDSVEQVVVPSSSGVDPAAETVCASWSSACCGRVRSSHGNGAGLGGGGTILSTDKFGGAGVSSMMPRSLSWEAESKRAEPRWEQRLLFRSDTLGVI
jgi:hypothetical protein